MYEIILYSLAFIIKQNLPNVCHSINQIQMLMHHKSIETNQNTLEPMLNFISNDAKIAHKSFAK